jgi:hypothetical protein
MGRCGFETTVGRGRSSHEPGGTGTEERDFICGPVKLFGKRKGQIIIRRKIDILLPGHAAFSARKTNKVFQTSHEPFFFPGL